MRTNIVVNFDVATIYPTDERRIGLINDYYNYTRKYIITIIRKNKEIGSSPGIMEDDLHDAGIFGLVKAAVRFDFDKGVEFKTFLHYNLHFAFHHVFQKYSKNCRKCFVNSDFQDIDIIDETPNHTQIIEDSDSNMVAKVVEVINSMTHERRKYIMQEKYFHNRTQRQIAKELNVSYQAINQQINAAIKYIRKELCIEAA